MKGHPVLTNGTGKLILPSVGPCPSRPEPETETDETKYRQSADRGHGWGAMLHRECCRDTETELIVHADQSPTVHSQFGTFGLEYRIIIL